MATAAAMTPSSLAASALADSSDDDDDPIRFCGRLDASYEKSLTEIQDLLEAFQRQAATHPAAKRVVAAHERLYTAGAELNAKLESKRAAVAQASKERAHPSITGTAKSMKRSGEVHESLFKVRPHPAVMWPPLGHCFAWHDITPALVGGCLAHSAKQMRRNGWRRSGEPRSRRSYASCKQHPRSTMPPAAWLPAAEAQSTARPPLQNAPRNSRQHWPRSRCVSADVAVLWLCGVSTDALRCPPRPPALVLTRRCAEQAATSAEGERGGGAP